LINDEQRWSQYIRDSLIETTIGKDVLLLNRVEKPALLHQHFCYTQAEVVFRFCDQDSEVLT
jgi:hypothetical protein